jgi:hypothetical protein
LALWVPTLPARAMAAFIARSPDRR